MHKFKVVFKTRALYKVPYKKFGFASCFGSKIKIEGGRLLVFIPQLNGYIEKPIKNRVMYDDVITDLLSCVNFTLKKRLKCLLYTIIRFGLSTIVVLDVGSILI